MFSAPMARSSVRPYKLGAPVVGNGYSELLPKTTIIRRKESFFGATMRSARFTGDYNFAQKLIDILIGGRCILATKSVCSIGRRGHCIHSVPFDENQYYSHLPMLDSVQKIGKV